MGLFRLLAGLHEAALRTAPESQRWSIRAGIRNLVRHRERIALPNGESLTIICDHPQVLSRAHRWQSKEPKTIQWIDEMAREDVLWDIGANVGIYSLYAAKMNRMKVLSFEPMQENYQSLVDNVQENDLGDLIVPLPIALSDKNNIDTLFLFNTNPGASKHQLETSVDADGNPFEAKSVQSVLATRLDSFLDLIEAPHPTHIKIDVDGFEGKVIVGAKELIKNPKLRSILIEIHSGNYEIKDTLLGAGFELAATEASNHIFTR